jgi:hypothetical protein
MWKESQGKCWLKIGKKNLLKGLFHETEKDHTFDFGVGPKLTVMPWVVLVF